MGKEELKELIVANQNLIYSIVHKFRGKDSDDLFQAGCLGLINAYRNYDPKYNTKFTTYAYPYIIGEISKYISNNRNIHLSNDNLKLFNAMKKAEDFLRQQLQREATDEELCAFLEIDLYKLWEIRNAISTESLDYEYENGELYDVVVGDTMSHDVLLDLKNALSGLDRQERELIIKRYFYNHSQQELAMMYDTNQVKISRDEKKILCKLKAKMY